MRIKFQTAADVSAAFPTLADDMDAATDQRAPLEFLNALAQSEEPETSLTFFAYLAPKRDSVWWACRCLRALEVSDETGALKAAEAWVAHPDEDERLDALRLGDTGPSESPSTWAALAAGWSGGNIAAPDGPPVTASPPLTAKAVRASVLIAVADAPFAERSARLERCLDEALAVANDDVEARFD